MAQHAASQSDYWSDTHWLRSNVDEFLARQCVANGCELIESANIENVRRDGDVWKIRIAHETIADETRELKARWLIDAGGGGDFSERWLGNRRDDAWMKTKTGSIFGHFQSVEGFGSQGGLPSANDPVAGFHVDDSAQHHVTDDGWMWMLRFDTGVTSVGMVQPTERWKPIKTCEDAAIVWEQWVNRYPSISQMLSTAKPVENESTWLRWSNRLSRCRQRAVGDGWILLPTAFGFVDPLHSTGIAHALSGVLRLAELLVTEGSVDKAASSRWVAYDRQLRSEIEWIDLLVGGCYRSLPSYATFCAFASWYFISAIQFERVMASDPNRWMDGYLTCDNEALRTNVMESFHQLSKQDEAANVKSIRKGIHGWNDVGFLDRERGQRIPHTAPPKYAC